MTSGRILLVAIYSSDTTKTLRGGLSLSNWMLCTLAVSYGRKLSRIIKIKFFSLRDLLSLIDIFLEKLWIGRVTFSLSNMLFMIHYAKQLWRIYLWKPLCTWNVHQKSALKELKNVIEKEKKVFHYNTLKKFTRDTSPG